MSHAVRLPANRPRVLHRSSWLTAIAVLSVLASGAADAVSTTVVISEFRTRGPSGGNDEFIELYNLSASPVNIGGFKLNGSNNAGTTSTRVTVTANTILNPGCRFLATNSAASGYSGAVAGNQTYATGITDDGGVALLNASNTIIDAVGMSAGSAYKEGTTLAPTGSSVNQSQERKPIGQNSQDTDNNATDFALNAGSSNPQNLASSCSGQGQPVVNLSVSTATATEAAQTVVTVTATASAAVSGGDQTVALAVAGANLIAGDYTLSNTTITIPNGGTSGSVTFTVQDDVAAEGLEAAILTISSPTSGILLGSATTQNIVIVDNDGNTVGCGGTATKISSLQNIGSSTPLANIAGVTIEGIVVGSYRGTSANSLQGFFVQEEDADADANPASSEGVFVFDGSNVIANGVAVGDKVRVTGTPQEFFNKTELGSLTALQICASSQTQPTPATLTLPVPGVPNGELAAATSVINNYYEAVEGMRVSYPSTLTVSEYFQLERYGQLVLSQGGRVPTFTAANEPSATNYVNHQIDIAKRKVILDDRDNVENSALANGTALLYPQPGLSVTNRFRGGDTITNLTGVLDWSFAGFSGTDAWRLRPVTEVNSYTFTAANPRPLTTPSVGGTLKVASFNVLNYFTTIDTTASSSSGPCGPNGLQDCRGADSAAELTRQRDKLVDAICGMNPDIAGLMEIENNASTSLSSVIAGTNAVANCGPYNFINTGTIGTDAIKVALIYKTATVSTVGVHRILNTAADARFIDTKNRPMLAQTFQQLSTGEKLTVAVNHLKSKGSDCVDVADPDTLDGQGNCNLTRRNAALAIVDWLATDPTGSGDPDFLVIGDLNSYTKEDPIDAIIAGPDDVTGTADDYTNLVSLFGGTAAYGYVFDGQTGYLDHALASPTLVGQVTGTADWHINADEPVSLDYNDTILDAGEASFEAKPSALPLYAPDRFRTSDHDPVLIGLRLGPPDADADGIPDSVEIPGCSNELDADSDDDGIPDGTEDANKNGALNAGETNLCSADTDGDGIQDGTESGYTAGVTDPDGAGPLLGTNGSVFVPDANAGTTTNALLADTDGDGAADGVEDANHNGAIDNGESDPNNATSTPANPQQVPSLPWWAAALGALALIRLAGRRLQARAVRY